MKNFLFLLLLVPSISGVTSDNSVEPKQIECLSEALYFEGRSESEEGQRAIAEVILNRVANKSYPSTICTVVRQTKFYPSGGIDLHSCQFSYYCDGRSDKPKFGPTWEDCLMVAEWALQEGLLCLVYWENQMSVFSFFYITEFPAYVFFVFLTFVYFPGVR